MGNKLDCIKRPLPGNEDKAEIYALFGDGVDQQGFGPEDTPVNLEGPMPEDSNMPKPPQIKRDDEAYLRKLFEICDRKGKVRPYNDFSLNGWRRYYPENEQFFLWEKGEVVPNQTVVENEDDYENLEIYQGDLSPDLEKRNGFGVLTTPKYVRIGQWRDNEFTGWGRECRRNGDVLEAKFVNGKANGKGMFTNLKGNVYEGDFVNNLKHGKGEVTTNKIHYIGDFANDKPHGQGEMEFKKEGNRYKGEFRKGQIYGDGEFTFNNGDVYKGKMINGKRQGFGKYSFSGNEVYEGNYENGKRDGHGRYYFPTGEVFEGEFKKGTVSVANSLIKDGKSLPIEINNGKMSVIQVSNVSS